MACYIGEDKGFLRFGGHLRHFFAHNMSQVKLHRHKLFIDLYYPNLSEQVYTASVKHLPLELLGIRSKVKASRVLE